MTNVIKLIPGFKKKDETEFELLAADFVIDSILASFILPDDAWQYANNNPKKLVGFSDFTMQVSNSCNFPTKVLLTLFKNKTTNDAESQPYASISLSGYKEPLGDNVICLVPVINSVAEGISEYLGEETNSALDFFKQLMNIVYNDVAAEYASFENEIAVRCMGVVGEEFVMSFYLIDSILEYRINKHNV